MKGLFTINDAMGNPVGTGHAWECKYCAFQSHCDQDG
jgi:hypothetical protein